jgi:hypothetical protein
MYFKTAPCVPKLLYFSHLLSCNLHFKNCHVGVGLKPRVQNFFLITIEYLLGTIGEFDKLIGFYFRKFFRLAQFNPLLGHLDPLANDANFYVHVNLRHNKKLCTKIKIK